MIRLSVLLAGCVLLQPSLADDKKKPAKKKQQKPWVVTNVLQRLKNAKIDDEQEKKIKELIAEYTPKLRAQGRKLWGTMTADQKKQFSEARNKAIAQGKKLPEAGKAGLAAVTFTDEQKKARKEISKEQQDIAKAFRKAVAEVLTPEQRKAFWPKKKKDG